MDKKKLISLLRDIRPDYGNIQSIAALQERIDSAIAELDSTPAAPTEMQARDQAELTRLRALVNNPELHDFSKGVVLEAAHQRERWGPNHDSGKSAPGWFWLIGYLAQKAMVSQGAGDTAKALHHTITTAAACANWHAAIAGTGAGTHPEIPQGWAMLAGVASEPMGDATAMYMRLAEAMGYDSGKDGIEFSPEEFAARLRRDADELARLRSVER